MSNNKDLILKLYYIEKLRVVDISKELGISKSAVTQVLKRDEKYIKEKELRKKQNKVKHNKQIQKWVENKRREKDLSDFQILKVMHEQASRELSGGNRPISNRAFRNWNTSIYKFNEKSSSYVLKKGINVGADVPRRINWKI